MFNMWSVVQGFFNVLANMNISNPNWYDTIWSVYEMMFT
jgi:hypothetical protein